ncbi:hypothetical protein Q5Y75_13225 [Ruegeria sp. 2205SS24-7]|uniref:hypothetical protein n=1 Tax=Ruegeria discodermiae TaxID=3064389 RepID=UPI0027421D0A|nr:hypothetical protein [Ruegeria sp. 2205SS24-7]MDP5218185.1 hypothetical protein [Ruegeria sp. 2205SS24-7]
MPIFADPAPVCLFAFNRPQHTKRTLDALAASPLAPVTELIAYIDGPRTPDEAPLVDEVAEIIARQTGFAGVTLHRRAVNAGLATSIQDGVTETMRARGKAIVVEDDIVTSPAFLTYMNTALERYKNDRRVWHIAGYNEELPALRDRPGAVFWRFMSCWGWASWADRWQHFECDPEKLVTDFSSSDIHRFNLDGAENFWSQVEGNVRGEIRTWAVFWYATIFRNNGLCLSPYASYAENIGLDGSGTHCGVSEGAKARVLNLDFQTCFPDDVREDYEALQGLRAHYGTKPGKLRELRRRFRQWKNSVLR